MGKATDEALAMNAIPENIKVDVWGFYFSAKGDESPKHGMPCKVIDTRGGSITLEFKDRRFGFDSLNLGTFRADPKAEFA